MSTRFFLAALFIRQPLGSGFYINPPSKGDWRGALNGRDPIYLWGSLPAPRARYLDQNPPGVFIGF
jgi:hypothetical protein